MTVAELIDRLTAFPPDLTVVVGGYEGGVTEKVNPKVIKVIPNANEAWWYGEHEPDEKGTVEMVDLG